MSHDTDVKPDTIEPKGLLSRGWEEYKAAKQKIVEKLTPRPTPVPFVKPPASDERAQEVATRFKKSQEAQTAKGLNALTMGLGIPVTFEPPLAGIQAMGPRRTAPEVQAARTESVLAVSPQANLDKPPYGVLAAERIKSADLSVPPQQIGNLWNTVEDLEAKAAAAASDPRASQAERDAVRKAAEGMRSAYELAMKTWEAREPGARATFIEAGQKAQAARETAAATSAARAREADEALRHVPGGEFVSAEMKTAQAKLAALEAEEAALDAWRMARIRKRISQHRQDITPGLRKKFLNDLREGGFNAEGQGMSLDEMFAHLTKHDEAARVVAAAEEDDAALYGKRAQQLWEKAVASTELAKKLASSTMRDAKLYAAARAAGKGIMAAMKVAPAVGLSVGVLGAGFDLTQSADTTSGTLRYLALTGLQRPVELDDVQPDISAKLSEDPGTLEKLWEGGILASSLYDDAHRLIAAKEQDDVEKAALAASDAQWRAAGATVIPGGRRVSP